MINEKYILIMIVVILFCHNSVHAQSRSDNSSDKVTLRIVLYPIQTLMVNPTQDVVDLNYSSKEDYFKGVTTKQDDHLTIYSTGGFEVNVAGEGENLTGKNNKIAASDIQVRASQGSNNTLVHATYEPNVGLSPVATKLLSSPTGGVAQDFNVEYSAAGNDAYINHFDADDAPTVYTTTVTYTILSQ